MAEPVHIRDVLPEFFVKYFGKPCSNQTGAYTPDCQHDCEVDKGIECWKRILSEDRGNGQDNT